MNALRSEMLVGTWRLDDFRIEFSDGRAPLFPFGNDAVGLLMYGADGAMSAVLSRTGRAPLGTERLETASSAGVEEKARAFDSYLSYAGRWHLDGNLVVHTVEYALVPNILGLEQVRQVELDGDLLTLRYELTARSGVTRKYQLTWRRSA